MYRTLSLRLRPFLELHIITDLAVLGQIQPLRLFFRTYPKTNGHVYDFQENIGYNHRVGNGHTGPNGLNHKLICIAV